MADDKEKDAKTESELPPKLALLSGKGMVVVFILLALEGVGGGIAYYVSTRPPSSTSTAEFEIIPQEKFKFMVATDAPGKEQASATLEFAIEVKSADAETVKKNLAAFGMVVRARISEKLRARKAADLRAGGAETDLSKWVAEVYNMTLREKAPQADQSKWKEGPVIRVWIVDLQVQ